MQGIGSLPVKSIHTPQELLLLDEIIKAFGTAEKRLEFLSDPKMSADSKLAKGEWQLWRSRLEVLAELKHWEELYKISKALLERGRTKDSTGKYSASRFCDWKVWEGYLSAAMHLEDVYVPINNYSSKTNT